MGAQIAAMVQAAEEEDFWDGVSAGYAETGRTISTSWFTTTTPSTPACASATSPRRVLTTRNRHFGEPPDVTAAVLRIVRDRLIARP